MPTQLIYNSPHSFFKTSLSSLSFSLTLLALTLRSGFYSRHSLGSYSSLPSRLSSTPNKPLSSTRANISLKTLNLAPFIIDDSLSILQSLSSLPMFSWIPSHSGIQPTTKWAVKQASSSSYASPYKFFPILKFAHCLKVSVDDGLSFFSFLVPHRPTYSSQRAIVRSL